MAGKNIKVTLRVWRQKGPDAAGRFVDYKLDEVSHEMSFLEMLDVLNQQLIKKGEDPVAFDSDCREGICGMCGFLCNGNPHGPEPGTTVCQVHMRSFKEGDVLTLEPFRAAAFPVLKDLSVDRSAFDRIQAKGGYVSINTGNPKDANAIPVPKVDADWAMDAAACIGCGACVAACKNASAMLFTSAKVSQFASLPQGQAERYRRAVRMVEQMDTEGFGACTNTGACSATCPKEISMDHMSQMNRDYLWGKLIGEGS
ncbi:MAG: succinate dehydrogenase/fumarate reductase iron-sulfur subunit [Bdellovibrionales bacterium]